MKIHHQITQGLVAALILCASFGSAWAESPKETYESYLATVLKADSLKDIFKYLTDERIDTIEEGLKKAASQGVDPKTIETFTLELLSQGANQESKFTELIIDDEASVVVEREQVTVEVLMVLHEGVWKIADERMLRIPTIK